MGQRERAAAKTARLSAWSAASTAAQLAAEAHVAAQQAFDLDPLWQPAATAAEAAEHACWAAAQAAENIQTAAEALQKAARNAVTASQSRTIAWAAEEDTEEEGP